MSTPDSSSSSIPTGSYPNAGRISQKAVLGSSSALFALVLVMLSCRMYIRLCIHKTFQADDGLIIFGAMLLTIAMAMLYHFIDEMFTVEAFLTGQAAPSPALVSLAPMALDFRKWVAASLSINWTTITAVKFSFLVLFRRLIDRLQPMKRYWWFVCGYTSIVYVFGILTCFVPFQGLRNPEELINVIHGTQYHLTVATAIPQLVFNAVGDILILAIPIHLIYRIRVPLSQKVALSFSLCLTILLIALTITRASGLTISNTIDVVWEVYWQFISAAVGLILSCASAFRALFVSRNANPNIGQSPDQAQFTWLRAIPKRLSHAFSSVRWSKKSDRAGTPISTAELAGEPVQLDFELPQVPRAVMTGIRSLMRSRHGPEEDENEIPELPAGSIMVSRTIEVSYSQSWPQEGEGCPHDGRAGAESFV